MSSSGQPGGGETESEHQLGQKALGEVLGGKKNTHTAGGPPCSLHLGDTAKHLGWQKGTSLREDRGNAGMGKTRKIQKLARYRVLMRGQRVIGGCPWEGG